MSPSVLQDLLSFRQALEPELKEVRAQHAGSLHGTWYPLIAGLITPFRTPFRIGVTSLCLSLTCMSIVSPESDSKHAWSLDRQSASFCYTEQDFD